MAAPASLIRNATILTMNDALETIEGAVLVRGGRIAAVGPEPEDTRGLSIIDAAGAYLLPGFIQTHVHLCQTVFRGVADDMPLLEWLGTRVWPMEAAHTPETLRASARLGAAELLLTGTTTALTMETVHDTDVVFEVLDAMGMRAIVGKCMMDAPGDAPRRLQEQTTASIDESVALAKRWNDRNGRLRAAFAPRFAISCSRELLEAVASLSHEHGVLVHTHASENRDEIDVVRQISGGMRNVEYLAHVGLATPHLCAAHCVWVDDAEQAILAERKVKVLHCPGSNLKLGSGIAPVVEMRARGISVSLGADGAACNNRLDMFDEMRLAATLQSVRHRPGALTARDAVWMATREGARALGLDAEIGSVEVGKRADLILIDRTGVGLAPDADPWSSIVYAARGTDVTMTMVDGEILTRGHQLVHDDAAEITADGRAAARQLAAEVGLAGPR
ncbi:MAG TPA: 5'-deoxyadenosine deaminase [Vicinamibacterales bacterium]|jgi:5-methylthioadenosine/S-adenosylhomocysteine deaminase|nr:5'-deoxyadenosine deaminase [Vicinamibacterales bacterium]